MCRLEYSIKKRLKRKGKERKGKRKRKAATATQFLNLPLSWKKSFVSLPHIANQRNTILSPEGNVSQTRQANIKGGGRKRGEKRNMKSGLWSHQLRGGWGLTRAAWSEQVTIALERRWQVTEQKEKSHLLKGGNTASGEVQIERNGRRKRRKRENGNLSFPPFSFVCTENMFVFLLWRKTFLGKLGVYQQASDKRGNSGRETETETARKIYRERHCIQKAASSPSDWIHTKNIICAAAVGKTELASKVGQNVIIERVHI